jgi:hypothetical protein
MTNRMIFTQEYDGWSSLNESCPPSTVTMELRGDVSLPVILENLERFLKGCGYHFDGHLDFVEEDSFDSPLDSISGGDGYWNDDNMGMTLSFPDGTEETVTMDDHSKYYYDSNRNK